MEITKISYDQWNEILTRCNDFTFFHSPHWYAIWKKYGSVREILALRFDWKNESCMIPFGIEKSPKGLQQKWYSSPEGTYGAWICDKQMSHEFMDKVANYLATFANIQIRFNPFCNYAPTPSLVTSNENTYVIRLKEIHKDITTNWSENHKRSLQKAHKAGLKIDAVEDWDAYSHIYSIQKEKRGSNAGVVYDNHLFSIIADIPEIYRKLWVVEKDGIVMAGAIVFYYQKHAVYWNGASISPSREERANFALFEKIIGHAKEEGYSTFDFNPSGGYHGVDEFKKGFGAEALQTSILDKNNFLYRIEKKCKKWF